MRCLVGTVVAVVAVACRDAEPQRPRQQPEATEPPETPPILQPAGPADLDDDGFDESVDCDDLYAGIFPGAPERCNDLDDDCDGQVDEDPVDAVTSYPDGDGDGFGDDTGVVVSCDVPAGNVATGGDCDGADPGRRPGAPELCDDVDQDCDPLTLEDGLASVDCLSFTSVQAALDAASDGSVVTLCDGTWTEHLVVPPYAALTITSLHGRDVTVLDGGLTGPILLAEGTALTLTGITFQNGYGNELFGQGAGVHATGGELTVTDCAFVGNEHVNEGGALALEQTPAVVTGTTFADNLGEGDGGGAIWAFRADVVVTDCEFTGNGGGFGGAIHNQEASLRFERCTFTGNDASFGGAIYSDGTLTCVDTTFEDNTAQSGGALYLETVATLDGVTIVGNSATGMGGGFVTASGVDVVGSTIHSNTASDGGGAAGSPYNGGVLSSTGSDWGIGATDNAPDDVFMDWGNRSYQFDTDFACNLAFGRCQ